MNLHGLVMNLRNRDSNLCSPVANLRDWDLNLRSPVANLRMGVVKAGLRRMG